MARKNVIEVLVKLRDQASGGLGTLGGKVGALHNKLTAGSAAVAGAGLAIGTALGAMIYKTAQMNDNIAKTSQQLGVTTEFLSEMDHAVRLAGASLPDFTTGIKRLSRAASDAGHGLETYKRIFDELGIAVMDNNGVLRDSEILFMEAADAIARLDNDTKKAAVAQELFGRGGMKLIPLLNKGAAGIREMQQEARRLGLTLSQEAARKSEDFIDSLERIKSALRGVTQELTDQFEKPLTDWANKLAETIPKAGEWIDENERTISSMKDIGASVTLGAGSFWVLSKAMTAIASHPIVAALTAIVGAIVLAHRSAPTAAEDVDGMRESFEKFIDPAWNASENLGLLESRLTTLEPKTEDFIGQLARGVITLKEWSDLEMDKLGPDPEKTKQLAESNEQAALHAETLAQMQSNVNDEIERMGAALANLEGTGKIKLLAIFGREPADIENLFDFVNDKLVEIPPLLNTVEESSENMYEKMKLDSERTAQVISRSFGSFVSSAVMDADRISEHFERFWKGLIAQAMAAVAKMAALRFLRSAFGIPFGEGGGYGIPIIKAQSGLEVIGGERQRDTIPTLMHRGEVAIPSPTVERWDEILENISESAGVTIQALFYTGSREESYKAAEYINKHTTNYNRFVVEGGL